MLIPHKVKNKGKYISFHYLRGWKARKIRKVQEISPTNSDLKCTLTIIHPIPLCAKELQCTYLPYLILPCMDFGLSDILLHKQPASCVRKQKANEFYLFHPLFMYNYTIKMYICQVLLHTVRLQTRMVDAFLRYAS